MDEPWEGKVFKVMHTILRGGRTAGVLVSDLIFTPHGPLLVLEWSVRADGEVPAVTVPLDPRELSAPPDEGGDWVYGPPVADPRPLN